MIDVIWEDMDGREQRTEFENMAPEDAATMVGFQERGSVSRIVCVMQDDDIVWEPFVEVWG